MGQAYVHPDDAARQVCEMPSLWTFDGPAEPPPRGADREEGEVKPTGKDGKNNCVENNDGTQKDGNTKDGKRGEKWKKTIC